MMKGSNPLLIIGAIVALYLAFTISPDGQIAPLFPDLLIDDYQPGQSLPEALYFLAYAVGVPLICLVIFYKIGRAFTDSAGTALGFAFFSMLLFVGVGGTELLGVHYSNWGRP